jgi:hypothetical protein
MTFPLLLVAVAVVPILHGDGFAINIPAIPISFRRDDGQLFRYQQESRSNGDVVALFHRSHDSALGETDDHYNENPLPPLPSWAVSNVIVPPSDDKFHEVEILYLGSDDFVSLELENDKAMPELFCATVVYEDPNDVVRYHVEPRMGTIEPNGGLCEVTVQPIQDEDDVADLTQQQEQLKALPSPAWLIISTEESQWYYKLENSPTDEI